MSPRATPTFPATTGAVILGALALLAPGPHPAPGAPPGDDAPWIEAVTQAQTDLELAFTIPGLVNEVLVAPGDLVEAGRTLVRLDDREVAGTVALLRVRAESVLAIQEAEALLGLARNELARVEQAHAQGAVSDYEVERARLDVTRREVALARAQQEKQEALIQLEQAVASADRYALRTPVGGVVEQVVIEQGETVQELQPVVRVVSVDPLRIDVAAPLEQTLTLGVGSPVLVAWAEGKAQGQGLGTGRVVHVASVADAASGTRLVRVRLPNPGLAPAGARVKVRFPDVGGEGNPPTAPATAIE